MQSPGLLLWRLSCGQHGSAPEIPLRSLGRGTTGVLTKPTLDRTYQVLHFLAAESAPCRYPVPLLHTAAAAGGRRVLCHENRMTSKGCLLPVVFRLRRAQTLLDEAARMLPDLT